MRMRELEEQSGMARTAIHHYFREGLLPEPDKTASNAALYTAAHVERLGLIGELRSGRLGPHSLPSIRRILARVEAGEALVSAIALEQIVDEDGGEPGPLDTEGLARAAGVKTSVVEDFVDVGLLVERWHGPSFDESDVAVVQLCAELFNTTPLESADLTPIVELIGEVVRYERDLAALVSTVEPATGHGRVSLERALGVLHAYLFARVARNESETFA